MKRHLNFNTLNNIGDELTKVHWHEFYRLNDIQSQADSFYTILSEVINKHAPLCRVNFKNNDKPWVTEYFKHLISRRDEAFKVGRTIYYKKLRNQVNRVTKSLKTQFYLDQVQCLKSEKPKYWWQHIKQLSGAVSGRHCDCLTNLTRNGNQVESELLSEVINEFFCFSH
jgi:hypothetical protein